MHFVRLQSVLAESEIRVMHVFNCTQHHPCCAEIRILRKVSNVLVYEIYPRFEFSTITVYCVGFLFFFGGGGGSFLMPLTLFWQQKSFESKVHVWAKSFADDLNKERGIVRGRVAVLLRSSEIKPLFSDFTLRTPRFESGRGRCVESLDKALHSHCPKEKPSH